MQDNITSDTEMYCEITESNYIFTVKAYWVEHSSNGHTLKPCVPHVKKMTYKKLEQWLLLLNMNVAIKRIDL